jgi:hypothetical protein
MSPSSSAPLFHVLSHDIIYGCLVICKLRSDLLLVGHWLGVVNGPSGLLTAELVSAGLSLNEGALTGLTLHLRSSSFQYYLLLLLLLELLVTTHCFVVVIVVTHELFGSMLLRVQVASYSIVLVP